ncbi:acyl-CoA dehydrogenase family protein [Paraburkholderia saeva]|uniref:Acyl-CoA dehydrogenase n=1 Tax=Paraburkholderia saeva TaxID=2777537 RepID=A0A9N8X086_9BURK|nr:acyl-CoA dehydrogenase family protein [Paraburkholderia saeva]CAG4886820.1 Acyl-CoA dehydrogenase [Paraburkholderia saeva]CAG4887165.1 Acyl-CoA dehydrogenase [Paraburkholderia saeva]
MERLIFEAEHDIFRDSARRFYQREVGPHGEQWRERGCVDREAFLKAGEQGYLLMWADQEHGGAGVADFRYEQILMEENARYGDSGFFHTLHSRLVGPYIGKLGNDEQRARILPKAARGEAILAIAMTEPQTGSDLAGIRARAEEKDDYWLLNGAKTFISNGILADYVVVAARTSPDNPHAIGLFIVERGMPGFERGRKLKKMGLQSQDTAELFFDNVRVPKANVLGDAAQGFRYLTRHLAEERLLGACGYIASAQVAFDLTLDYVKERKAFGRPVGTFQNSRFKLAQLRAEIDALQTFVDQCVLLHNAGKLNSETAAAAKLLCSELEGRMTDEGVQLHGGAGYMDEYRISRMYTDARISRIYAGSSEIMREIIGRSLGLDDRKLG